MSVQTLKWMLAEELSTRSKALRPCRLSPALWMSLRADGAVVLRTCDERVDRHGDT